MKEKYMQRDSNDRTVLVILFLLFRAVLELYSYGYCSAFFPGTSLFHFFAPSRYSLPINFPPCLNDSRGARRCLFTEPVITGSIEGDMDSSLRMGPFSSLVYSALANAWLSELFHQMLEALHMISLQQPLPSERTFLLMPWAEIRLLRQRIRSHCCEPVHIAQTTPVLERRPGQTTGTYPEREMHLCAESQGVEKAVVMVAICWADLKGEVAQLVTSLGAHSAQPGVLRACSRDEEMIAGEENGHCLGVNEAVGRHDGQISALWSPLVPSEWDGLAGLDEDMAIDFDADFCGKVDKAEVG